MKPVCEYMKGIELCNSVNPVVDKILEIRLLKEIPEAFKITFKYFGRENKETEALSTPSIPEYFLYGLGAGTVYIF